MISAYELLICVMIYAKLKTSPMYIGHVVNPNKHLL